MPGKNICWKSLKEALRQIPRNDVVRDVERNFPDVVDQLSKLVL